MEIRVLGPLELADDEGVVAVAPKERQLLAALVVEAGRTCSRDALIDALWGSAPPRSAPKLLQVYVSKLRRLLPGPARILTREPGYAIELDDGMLDAARFESLLAAGREAADAGNPALAASLLQRGLALWHGPAYEELAEEEFARAEAARLDDLRLVALEERFEAELALGYHQRLLTELGRLADAYPLRERLQGQLMLALYRAGRQVEALDAFSRTRSHLSDELGLEPGPELRELQRQILQQDSVLDAPAVTEAPASLPAAPNPLLGRDHELAELSALLERDDVRLLVLTGAGGSGKTRLAIEAVRRTASSFANGGAFVGLASLRDPDLFVTTIAGSLGIHVAGEPLEALAGALESRELLLLLDNAEHLRTATPALVDLLARAPRLRILVTSRVVLHLSGEHVYPVHPLAEETALELFLERARQADADFRAGRAEEDSIRRICERVDRLPLAIELAAGRVRSLTVDEMVSRLDERLPLLIGGPADLPARQQTLRATLEWSVELLDESERRDLARLSVFASAFTLASAETVCETTLDRLASLVDQNLLQRATGPHGSRYSLLETIRELGIEMLAASNEGEELRRRHAENALAVAESLGLSEDHRGTGIAQQHDLAISEQNDMRAALDWAVEADPELGLKLAISLGQFWIATNPREGTWRLEALLAGAPELPLELRARALRDLGATTSVSGEKERSTAYYEQSLELFESIGDEAGTLRLKCRLANATASNGDLAGGRKLAEEALERARLRGHRSEESDLLSALSWIEGHEGNAETAYALRLQSLELGRSLGEWAWGDAIKLMNLSELAAWLGRYDEAEEHAREALVISRGIGDAINTVFSLVACANVARLRGDDERAGRLWGAVEAEEKRRFLGRWATYYRETFLEEMLEPASVAFERGRAHGQGLILEEAVAEALDG